MCEPNEVDMAIILVGSSSLLCVMTDTVLLVCGACWEAHGIIIVVPLQH